MKCASPMMRSFCAPLDMLPRFSSRVLDNGNYTYRLKLEINKFYTLERENIKYLVYVEDAFDNSFMNFKYDQKLKLVIGKGNDCNVNYNIEYINNDIVVLSFRSAKPNL